MLDDPASDASLWDDVVELTEAVMRSRRPAGFVRRRVPVGGRRANAYAKLASGGDGQPATLVVVIAPGEDAQTSRSELRRRFGLTRREAEVALLLAERRSNREIAEALFIAETTARKHTEKVLTKLNTNSRTDVGAIVARANRGWEGPA